MQGGTGPPRPGWSDRSVRMYGVERHREVLKPSQLRQATTKRNYVPTDHGREMKRLSSKPMQGLGSIARLHNTTCEALASTTSYIRRLQTSYGIASEAGNIFVESVLSLVQTCRQ
jgi:hypothetical protein